MKTAVPFSDLHLDAKWEAMKTTANSARACVELMGHINNELERHTAESFATLLLEQAQQMCGIAVATGNDISIDYTTAGGDPVSINLQLTPAEVEFITDRQALQSAVASDAACREVPCLWKRRLDVLIEACQSHIVEYDFNKFWSAVKAAMAPVP